MVLEPWINLPLQESLFTSNCISLPSFSPAFKHVLCLSKPRTAGGEGGGGRGGGATEHDADLTPVQHELTAYRPICSLDGNKLAAEQVAAAASAFRSLLKRKACAD